jgi:membrane protease YdiL (CAAX protease family)
LRWSRWELEFGVWVALALAALIPVMLLLRGSFPLFTVLWLTVPLVVVWRTRDARRVGFGPVPRRLLLETAALNLGALLLLAVVFEPWSHAYQALVRAALTASQPDTTFAWLLRYEGWAGWTGMALYSGLITLFAEELFFRGWLLRWLRPRLGTAGAIVLQATLFTLPNLIAAFLLTPVQGAVYAVVYAWLGIGIVGGWAAARTGTIWPSLLAATLCNLILTLLVL